MRDGKDTVNACAKALAKLARQLEVQQREARKRQRIRQRASMLGWIGASVLGHRMPSAASLVVGAEWRRELLDASCWRCGVSRTPFEDLRDGCAECRARSMTVRGLKLHGVIRLGRYAPPLSQWVPAIKQHAWRDMGLTMGHELGLQVAEAIGIGRIPRPDAVVPVPVHWTRRMLRGIDHAGLLAEEVARVLGIPCVHALRARLRGRQKGAGRGGRLSNRQRFVPSRAVQREMANVPTAPGAGPITQVLLIDDVRTTGATTIDAARGLRELGVEGISIAVCAVADPPRRNSLSAGAETRT